MSVAHWDDGEQALSLLRQAEDGDSAAVNKLLALNRPSLRRYVGLRLNPRMRARVDESDIVQDAFQEATRRIADFLERRPMPFRLWLRRIAFDRLVMEQRRHIRAARRSVVREALISDESSYSVFGRIFAAESSPSRRLRKEEMIDSMRHALASLKEHEREIVLLRMTENMPYGDIAMLLSITEEAARQRYGRAIRRLSEELASLGWSRHDGLA